jgi:hypothetical protein
VALAFSLPLAMIVIATAMNQELWKTGYMKHETYSCVLKIINTLPREKSVRKSNLKNE